MAKCPNCSRIENSDVCWLCGTTIRAQAVKPVGIPKVSKKRLDENEIYNKRRVEFLKENPKCAVYPELKSEEVHHKKGRIGKLFLDENFWLPVSKKAHDKITKNPTWAIKKGYSDLRLKTEK